VSAKRKAKLFNERLKLFAGALDRVALAAFVIGLLQPLASPTGLDWTAGLWLLGGVVLHVAAQLVLGLMREE